MNSTVPTSSAIDRIWQAVATVTDPEIPVLSVVDLGIIPDVWIADGRVTVQMCPTFAGCPALDLMRDNIRAAVQAAGFPDVTVQIVFDPPWSSDRISEEGRRRLKEFGLAPPAKCGSSLTEDLIRRTSCPYCDSTDTIMESIFGPTLCRAIHYCNACRQSFEQFKPV